MIILGIETSCDETAAALVRRNDDGSGEILSNIIHSQIDDHSAFGGVVPEIAARAHIEMLDVLIAEAMKTANLQFSDLDGVAATAGPGLIGGLIVGLTTGKAIASAANCDFFAINHLEGHALTARLTNEVRFPYLLVLVSGGHTQILAVEALGHYRRLATTIDDAIGEAFDKTAKLLSLGFPGGPAVEKCAKEGNPNRFTFPRPLLNKPGLNMSFAGLKTAVRQCAEQNAPLDDETIADICAAFQDAVADVLTKRISQSLDLVRADPSSGFAKLETIPVVIAGGVASNAFLRKKIEESLKAGNAELIAPPPKLCTDNAVMIAWAGAELKASGITHPLDFPARARWPLDDKTEPVMGSGKQGARV